MNVKDVSVLVDAELRREGFEERRLLPGAPKAWVLPSEEVLRFFQPKAIRRPWGFTYSGYIGLEIPELRKWLRAYKANQTSHIFQSVFAAYYIMNNDDRHLFMVEHGKPIPADLWAGLIKDRLDLIPDQLARLIDLYRSNREELGGLAHPMMREAWDFLLRWHDDPNPTLPLPIRLPDGRIANGS
jgi:hypothetical protein